MQRTKTLHSLRACDAKQLLPLLSTRMALSMDCQETPSLRGYKLSLGKLSFRMMSCLLKHFTRKIRSKVNRYFDVSDIILKIDIVYVNVKVVVRVKNLECNGCIPQC